MMQLASYQIPLSPYSKIFYAEWLSVPDRIENNILTDQYLEGDLNIERFERAMIRLVNDYLLVNSHIQNQNGQLYWCKNHKIYPLDYFKRPLSDEDIFCYIKKPFNLCKGPLYRFAVINLGHNRYRLLIVFHHIIINGIAAKFILEELSRYYNDSQYQAKLSLDNQLAKLTTLFNKLSTKIITQKTAYDSFWREQLSNIQTVSLDFLNLDSQREKSDGSASHSINPFENITRVGEIRFSLDEEFYSKLKRVTKKFGTTPYLLGQNVYALLLYIYTGVHKFAISYSVTAPETFDFIYGGQINTSLIPYDFSKVYIFTEVIEQSKRFYRALKGPNIKYSDLPIDHILAIANIELLNLAFDQAFVRMESVGFENIKTIMNYEINIDIYNSLWFGQEIGANKVCYSVLYKIDEIDSSLLTIFIDCYKHLLINIVNGLLEIEDEKFLNLTEIEHQLLSHDVFSAQITAARRFNSEIRNKNILPMLGQRVHEINNAAQNEIYIDNKIVQRLLAVIKTMNAISLDGRELIFTLGDEAEINLFMNQVSPHKLEYALEVAHSKAQKSSLYLQKIWKSSVHHKALFCNLPNIWENDDPLHLLFNMVIIEILASKALKHKIAIILPLSYLENGGSLLIKLFTNWEFLFGAKDDNYEKFCIFITQTSDHISLAYIKQEIENILKDNEVWLGIKASNFLRFLASEKAKNILLYKNFRLGEEDHHLQAFVLKAVDNISYIDQDILKFPLTEEAKCYLIALFPLLKQIIDNDLALLSNEISSCYFKLMEMKDIDCARRLLGNAKAFYHLLGKDIISSPFSQTSTPVMLEVLEKIETELTSIKFLQALAGFVREYRLLVEKLRESFNKTLVFIDNDLTSNIKSGFIQVLEIFLNDLAETIKQLSLVEIVKCIASLKHIKDAVIQCNSFSKLNVLINDFTSHYPNIEKFKYSSLIAENFDFEIDSLTVTYITERIESLLAIANNSAQILSQVSLMDFNLSFHEVCKTLSKSYSDYPLEQLPYAKKSIEQLERLVLLCQQDKVVNLSHLIKEVELLVESSVLIMPSMKEKMSQLKLQQQALNNIAEIEITEYINRLTRLYYMASSHYENLLHSTNLDYDS